MQDTRIAVVTMNSRVGDAAGNLKKVAGWVEKASTQHARLICFPELNLTGYHPGESIVSCAQPIPGSVSGFITDLSRKFNITILAGMAEIDNQNRLYASHIVVQPDGKMGIYRKTHLGPPERDLFTPGQSAPVFAGPGIRYGVQLCYDAHFPELSTGMAIAGADAIFIPHASPRGSPEQKLTSWMRHLPARASDNGLFVIACNPCGDNGAGLLFPGVTVVIGPSGNIMASHTVNSEHMLIANLTAEELNAVRGHPMRYFLPHRRPDLVIKDGFDRPR